MDIIREPEAAAVHCAHLTNLHRLRPSQNFMICDAGGGTVVSAKITCSVSVPTYSETLEPLGSGRVQNYR